MTSQGKTAIILLLAGLAVVVSAREPEFGEFRAVQESLSGVHPRMRARWLREHGLDDSYYSTFRKPDSQGLRCIGRWPWGPSWETCGQDSLLFLGSGSGVRILSITDSTNPRMLGQINARGLINQLVVQDSLLFVACGNWGAQVYSITDPANPRELGSMDAVVGDLTVKDTLCYTLGGDSFRIYNVADPSQPEQLSALRDSGDVIAVTNGHAFLGGRWVMNVYDVTDPTAPQWVNSRGGFYWSLACRRGLLFYSRIQPSFLSILDVSNPLVISEVGRLDGYGGRAVSVDEYFAYLSCEYDNHGLHIIDISDTTNPQHQGSLDPYGNSEFDAYVLASLSYAYLANYDAGLVTIDIHDVNSPTEAGMDFAAHQAVDVHVDNDKAYVAELAAGLRILDVGDPTDPQALGEYDWESVIDTRSATARDSFAYIACRGDRRRFFRVLDVSDPTQPRFAGDESTFNKPEDLVLRDSWVFAAEMNAFQVYNVARPREPELVGSCVGDGIAIVVQDSFAYTAAGATRITNIARPDNPFVVSTITGHGAGGIAVRDTFLYLPAGYDTVWVYSVADPAAPYVVGYAPMLSHLWDIALADSLAAVATVWGLDIISLADPAHPQRLGGVTTPYGPRRVVWTAPYFYTAMWDAGVAIYAVESVGVSEYVRPGCRAAGLSVRPNPTCGWVTLDVIGTLPCEIGVWDASGRCVARKRVAQELRRIPIDLADLKAGVYFIGVCSSGWAESVKVVRH